MINPEQVIPLGGFVTMFAQIARQEMGTSLTVRGCAVVTTGAIIRYLGVFEIRRNPGICGVTQKTLCIRLNMLRMFTTRARNRAIVTTAAGTDHISVIHMTQRQPLCAVMTILADILGLNMCIPFTFDSNAIMTAETVPADVSMSKVCRFPCIGRMTIGTDVAADDVGGTFALPYDVIMTALAGTNDLSMIDPGGNPVVVPMAVLADIAGADMGSAFTS